MIDRKIFKFAQFIVVVTSVYLGVTLFTTGTETYHHIIPKSESADSQILEDEFLARFTEESFVEDRVRTESRALCHLAVWNDGFLYHGSKYWTRKPIKTIGSRILAVGVFPIALAIDIGYSAFMSISTGFQAINTNDGIIQDNFWAYLRRMRKCSLGLIATPTSLFSPDIVTHHFIPKSRKRVAITSYGKLYSASATQLYPKTVSEVQEIIRYASKKGRTITLAGGLLSQGKQALPPDHEGILVHFSKMNAVQIDPEEKVARVQPGATWCDIQNLANEHSLAVRVMQASNVFTVGGSLAVNCHGWDHKSGALGETVRSLKVVTSKGDLLHLTPDNELFHYVIGGMGGFGAIVELEIELVENSQLTVQGEKIAPKDYAQYFSEEIQEDPSIDLHYYRLSLEPGKLFRTGVAVNYKKNGDAVSTPLVDEPPKGRVVDRIELQIIRRLNWSRKVAWKSEEKDALKLITTTRNEAMRPPILSIFNEAVQDTEWLQEFFVKPEHLDSFLSCLSTLLNKNKVQVFNASVRYVSKNSSKSFNYTNDGECFAVVLFFNQSLHPKDVLKTREWVKEVVDYLSTIDGTYYLAYQNFPTLTQFRESYPNWAEIKGKRAFYDPEGLFTNGFYQEYLTDELVSDGEISGESKFRQIFDVEKGMRQEVRDFINYIFKQLNDQKFQHLVDDVLQDPSIGDDEIYEKIYDRIAEASPGFVRKYTQAFGSLRELQDDLSDQVSLLLEDREYQGYAEIGYPGRMIRSLTEKIHLDGPFYVINDQETLSDYLESGFPRPYDYFVPANDFEPISSDAIPSNSLDVVAMYIGLHHTPKHKLDAFIRSIHRVLRPGGIFILMDHDAKTPEQQNFVSIVHSIFNAGTGVSLEGEVNEYRNFQSLDHWVNLVEKQGFRLVQKDPLIRKGDPTLNSLVAFVKTSTEGGSIEKEFKEKVDVFRPGIQTYLTAPEWQNVQSAQAYAQFIEHTPFYEFPYFSEIGNFWSVYRNSWKAARKHYSFYETATSEYTLMNTFIGVMTTVEYCLKGILSAPVAWYYTSEEHKEPEYLHLLIENNHRFVDEEVVIIETFSSGVAHVKVPRYKKGTQLMTRMAQGGVHFLSVSGQDRIQVDVMVGREAVLEIPKGAVFLYETFPSTDKINRVVALEVDVKELGNVIRSVIKQEAQVFYIHDF